MEILKYGLDSRIVGSETSAEIKLRSSAFDFARYRGDMDMMKKKLAELKSPCYRIKKYEPYFRAYSKYLRDIMQEGDIELAKQKAEWLKEEAERVDFPRGFIFYNRILADIYSSSENYEGAIEVYRNLLKSSHLVKSERYEIFSSLFDNYYSKKDYGNALKAQDSAFALLNSTSYDITDKDKNQYIKNELNYCNIYYATGDMKSFTKHLDKARKIFSEDVYYLYTVDYYKNLSQYFSYHKIKDSSLYYINRALEICNKVPKITDLLKTRINLTKAGLLSELGEKEKAAYLYESTISSGDSVINSIKVKQIEYIRNNYTSNYQSLKMERLARNISIIIIIITVILTLLLAFLAVHAARYRRSLKRDEKSSRESANFARRADKMKEIFLKGIISEIKPPLDEISALSGVLADNTALPAAQKNEYSEKITSNTKKLMDTVNEILNFSRLEAGISKFDIREYNAVQLCRSAVTLIHSRENNHSIITLTSDSSSAGVKVDYQYFRKMLYNILLSPVGSMKDFDIKFETKTYIKAGYILFIIKGSPLTSPEEQTESNHNIIHKINELIAKNFGGTYTIDPDTSEIRISFPIEN
jgi:hypothetical protein